MQVYELETKNGRIFRVAVENKSQTDRMFRKINENKGKHEEFIRIEIINNGINNIKSFEKLISG